MNPLRIAKKTNKTTKHVTYIMSSSFRILDNHSLYFALNEYDTCNIIIYPTQQENVHNSYIKTFIDDLANKLTQFGDVSICENMNDIPIINDVILDQGYLKEELLLEKYVRNNSNYSIIVIESNVVVPVWVTSKKEEYSARTIRPKIHKHLADFIDPVLEEFTISIQEQKAIAEVQEFIDNRIQCYHLKNHPEYDYNSGISIYLRFGILSPIRILMMVEISNKPNIDLFIEELVIRRELAYNFVFYNKNYDMFNSMTYEWAYQTMNAHLYDHREYIYTIEDYITFKTHDKYFNAAMKEMVYLGKMHGYMRMYWCKKIIEWSPSYEIAYKTAITLNNAYFLDGSNPNGYAGIAWCFGKHDRAWSERLVFGKLRYMNDSGLKRKFDIEKYIEKVENEVFLKVKTPTN